MVLYHQIILTIPKAPIESLVNFFRRHSALIISNGGVSRGIENHGVRPLQERFKKKYITSDGLRYFWEARYVSSIFDLNPKALIEIERLLRTDEIILRFHTIRHVVSAEKFDSRSYKNPYLEPRILGKKPSM